MIIPQASSSPLLSLSLPRPSLLAPPGPALLTIVSLRLLGQLGLVDLVFSVGHLGEVLAVVLTELYPLFTSQLLLGMIRLALVPTLHWSASASTRWSPALCPAWPSASEVVVTGLRWDYSSHPHNIDTS